MYGTLVGKLQCDVSRGELMTTTNTKHAAGSYAYRGLKRQWHQPDISRFLNRTFNGYKRSDGRVGTANYWLFVPMVFCENRNLDIIREALHKELGYAVSDKYNRFTQQLLEAYDQGEDVEEVDLTPSSNGKQRYFKNVDGIKFLNHTGGCGGTRQDASSLSVLLAAYADHPNVGGVTVLSLGCQHLQIEYFLSDLKKRNPSFDKPLLVFEQQKSGSE
jgi:altronate hydrolase